MNRLDILWQLQQVDTASVETQRELREAKGRLGESEELLQARKAVQEVEAELAHWRSRLRLQELELGSLDQKIAEIEDRLYGGRVTNPKELSSLQQDQEYLKRRQNSLEDDVLQAMAEIEDKEVILKARKEELAAIESAWTQEQQRLTTLIAELEAKATALSVQRAEICQTLSREDLELYEDLRRRRGGVAVTTLNGSLCLGCRVVVPTSKLQQARRKADLVFCSGCGRILYAG